VSRGNALVKLDPDGGVASQELGVSMAGMLNSEHVAPHLVYIADAERHEILTFADHTRAFHRQATYRVGIAPTGFAERPGGIFICCPGSGEVWVQKQASAPFERFTKQPLGHPVAVCLDKQMPRTSS
jgi:hypothetical protein